MRKVFLDELPRWESGKNKGGINWNDSIGCKVRFIYDDVEGEIEIVDYDINTRYLFIKYNNDKIYKINTPAFKKFQLGKLLKKITNEFRFKVGQVFKDEKRDLVIIDRKYEKDKNGCNRKLYKYKCNRCGFDCGEHYNLNKELKKDFWTTEYNILNGNGCSCCNYNPKIVIPHINSIVANPETYWMIKYFQGGYDEAKQYTKSSKYKIKPICPDCGRIKDKLISIGSIYVNKSISCLCGDHYSYGHKCVFYILRQLNQYFIDNNKLNWCKFYNPYKNKDVSGEYDFVIEDRKIIIEVDGSFHRQDNHMSGQTKEESQFLDRAKDKLAKENGYKIIRVIYDDKITNIKNNIENSELNCLFDLSNINWLKCEEFALSNRCKEACELKKNNPDMTTTEIGKIMNINYGTIRKYLIKGSKLGWCEYDANEEKKKNNKRNGERVKKIYSKPIEIFKEKISLGIFQSTSELNKQSKELFGVKLTQSCISDVLSGKSKQHKGFTFKYVNVI